MIFPRLNSQGGKLPELWKTVSEICRILPALDVHGDNSTTFVDEHANGKIIRAHPQANSAVAQSGGGATDEHDFPWDFSTYVNTSGNTIFRVKGGYYNRNGIFSKVNFTATPDSLDYEEFVLEEVITDNYLYFVHIYQEWVQSSHAWRRAEVRVTHDAPPEGYPLIYDEGTENRVYGYSLLGWIRRSGTEGNYTYDYQAYKTAVPTMIVAGEYRIGEV